MYIYITHHLYLLIIFSGSLYNICMTTSHVHWLESPYKFQNIFAFKSGQNRSAHSQTLDLKSLSYVVATTSLANS